MKSGLAQVVFGQSYGVRKIGTFVEREYGWKVTKNHCGLVGSESMDPKMNQEKSRDRGQTDRLSSMKKESILIPFLRKLFTCSFVWLSAEFPL